MKPETLWTNEFGNKETANDSQAEKSIEMSKAKKQIWLGSRSYPATVKKWAGCY